ncbi:hypothetical protein F5Y17DRAFT_441039 [Xylariaceae sp. FL0594]|nr:hypothetical protein F5Y17DRAFT_441039 [Xylariaceae sp. FL0594]
MAEAAPSWFCDYQKPWELQKSDVQCRLGHMHAKNYPAAGLLLSRLDRNGEIEILLDRRAAQIDHGETWALIGGYANDLCEDTMGTAMREAMEEYGLHPSKMRYLGLQYKHDHGGIKYLTYTYVFAQYLSDDAAPLATSDKPMESAWFTLRKLPDTLHPFLKADLPFLQHVLCTDVLPLLRERAGMPQSQNTAPASRAGPARQVLGGVSYPVLPEQHAPPSGAHPTEGMDKPANFPPWPTKNDKPENGGGNDENVKQRVADTWARKYVKQPQSQPQPQPQTQAQTQPTERPLPLRAGIKRRRSNVNTDQSVPASQEQEPSLPDVPQQPQPQSQQQQEQQQGGGRNWFAVSDAARPTGADGLRFGKRPRMTSESGSQSISPPATPIRTTTLSYVAGKGGPGPLPLGKQPPLVNQPGPSITTSTTMTSQAWDSAVSPSAGPQSPWGPNWNPNVFLYSA